jgi:ADP-ribose pyrophosphatase
VEQAPDPDEFLEVLTVSLAEALRWVRDGRITDVKTIIGLMWVKDFL